MTPAPHGAVPRLVEALSVAAEAHPVARKLLVCPSGAIGRELLRRLSLTGRGWIGFEVATPLPLALRLARPLMEQDHLSLMDSFEVRAFLDEALDATVSSGSRDFRSLSERVGFRDRVYDTIQALRLSGVGPTALDKARLRDRNKKKFLSGVLDAYERLLQQRRRADTAEVFRVALRALEEEGTRLPVGLDAEVLLLAPGLGTRGQSGRFIEALEGRGAKVLGTDSVRGVAVPQRTLWKPGKRPGYRSFLFTPAEAPAAPPPPPTEIFRAASVHQELREVLRRVVERGFRWDQVEIVAADATLYGSVLHAEASKLEIPVTFAVGLPVERTRAGRVARTYLEWIEGGFQADPIRRLLEAGDLRPPRSRRRHPAAVLARRFRSLRVGWGRDRYRLQIRLALAGLDELTPGRQESEEAFVARIKRARSELKALRSILGPTLAATPTVPEPGGGSGRRVSPSDVARGLRVFLRRVPRGKGPDRAAREEIDRVLERIEATLVRKTSFYAAVTAVRGFLDLRVRADSPMSPADDAPGPWSSEGGHLHVTDVEHGGFTGRDAVFLVGMDSDRVPGFVGQDALLLDGDRRVVSKELPTSSELSRERTFKLAALFARLHGFVTLSYSAWDSVAARELGPSPLLLQALRLGRKDPSVTFEDLEAELGDVASAVSSRGRTALDGDDAWMGELACGAVLCPGTESVVAMYPALADGVAARRRIQAEAGPDRGVVSPRPELFDPRRNAALVVSASRLEALGTCPLRYLHGAVLGIRPPDDPELDPERWLDPLRRGALLHGVFERTLREGKELALTADRPEFEELAMDALAHAVLRMRGEVPVPGEGALQREGAELEADVRSFVRMVRHMDARWSQLELKFGLGEDEPVELQTGGVTVRLRGAIDRIDEDLHGLQVIDYKTGAPRDYAGTGTFNGGRRLQHALYAYVAEQRLDGTVVVAGYHFPTMRGENRSIMFTREELAGVPELLDHMLDGVASGNFIPTNEADDCRFCDFNEVCRVRSTAYGKVESPLAVWSSEHLNAALLPAFRELKRVRTFEG